MKLLGQKCTIQKVYIHKISKKEITDDFIANFSLYASSRPRLNFGCYFTFEITFLVSWKTRDFFLFNTNCKIRHFFVFTCEKFRIAKFGFFVRNWSMLFPLEFECFIFMLRGFFFLIFRLYVVHCWTSWPRMERKIRFWHSQIHELYRMQKKIWYFQFYC